MFLKSMMNNLKTFTNSTITIDVARIEQAILMSTLTKKPVHIEGDWFAWVNQVMTKRMLLGVILYSTFGHCNSMAVNKVGAHYLKVKDQLPAKYRHSSAYNGNTLIMSISSAVVQHTISSPADDFVEPQFSTNAMQKLIVEVFGQEYESK